MIRLSRTAGAAAMAVLVFAVDVGAQRALGPVDAGDLPPSDLSRVAAGSQAPDFTLESSAGERVALSDYRGKKNVVLVFYRGHW